MASGGDWLVLQELLQRGDAEFVDRLRQVTDADALGTFAERWYADRSPNSRRLLLAYLDRPLNAYRHEALVKRLFKRAEAAGDDEVMARFLVAFDRSIRRVERTRRRYRQEWTDSPERGRHLVARWLAEGFEHAYFWEQSPGRVSVYGYWSDTRLTTPAGTTMPRGKMVFHDYLGFLARKIEIPDWVIPLKLDPNQYRDAVAPPESVRGKLGRFRLFTVSTRQYLRRRAWRYFRRLGKTHPDRYVPAISQALGLYEDADVASGLALLDNWGLVHALFHNSAVLESHPRGWRPAEGRSLSELKPAPIHEDLWRSAPRALVELMLRGRCRPVRQWAARMIRRDLARSRAVVGLDQIFDLLGHDDPEVVEFATEWLRGAENLAAVTPERWLAVAHTASPAALEVLAEIMARQIAPEQVTLAVAAGLAACRPLPLARTGLSWLKAKTSVSDEDRRSLFVLLEAEAEPLRPQVLSWLRTTLGEAPEFRSEWVLEFLDCRHADARAEGITWFRSEPRARDDVTLWQRLLESPYDDVRLALAADLEAMLAKAGGAPELSSALNPDRLRLLWASVLLNIRRGARVKPRVLGQVARRLIHRPDEAEHLLPLLSVALRSLRRPERNAALVAVVHLAELRPDAVPLIKDNFPELQWA
jgi:hypothetical protein